MTSQSLELKTLLQQFNFHYPPECISADFDQILDFIEQESYPVVMKIEHPRFSHKSDVGGVFLNLRNRTDVERAWEEINNIYSKSEIPPIERQVSIQPYYKDGIEIALGIIRDEMFGHFIMVGSGGIMIELFEDVAFAPSPISRYSANKLLRKLKLMKMLTGFRQFKPVNIEQIIEKILALDNLVHNNPQIEELDINPLMILPDGRMFVIDARVTYTN
jgi:succinyl-CoA synthetase beta subunit